MVKGNLKTGMFGKTSEGDLFCIVGNKLIYQDGEFDEIADMDEDMRFYRSGVTIESLYEAECFAAVADGDAKEIWHRPEPNKVEPKPVEDIGKTTVTITLEQYADAIERASKKFTEVAAKEKVDPMLFMIMSTQNITFGSLVGEELFGKHINKEDK